MPGRVAAAPFPVAPRLPALAFPFCLNDFAAARQRGRACYSNDRFERGGSKLANTGMKSTTTKQPVALSQALQDIL
jgi:hypothetical protein